MNRNILIFYASIMASILLHSAAQDQPIWQRNEALCIAASSGDETEVECLLKAHAQPNVPASAFGETALHCAAAGGHLKIVQLLLAYEADPNVRSNFTETSLHTVIEHLDKAKSSGVAIIQALIEAEVDVNTKESLEGNTGLHLIATNVYISNRYAFHIIKALVDAGADKEERNNKGFTPAEKAYAVQHQLKKDDPGKAYMLASRAAFMRIFPPATSDEEEIIALLFQLYSFDAHIATTTGEEIELLQLQDMHAYHKLEPYLHDYE